MDLGSKYNDESILNPSKAFIDCSYNYLNVSSNDGQNYGNLPIFETQEENETTTRRYLGSVTVDFGDEYERLDHTQILRAEERVHIHSRDNFGTGGLT